jgi:hypothetical protein
MREARASIHEASCAAVALLDASARKVVLRFPPPIRAWLYQQLATDTSGRLAQVAQTCPGVLTFAHALQSFGHRTACVSAANRLLRGIIDGRPLNLLVEDAVSTWASKASKKIDRHCTAEEHRRTWQCLDECLGNRRQALLRSQRLLIRRAGAGVASLTLWLPPPPAFAPEDIPKQKLANAHWFRVMKCLREILNFRDNVRCEHDYNLCMFVSLHALEIHKSKELGNSDYWRTSSLLDYARANNHWPKRNTSATRFLEAAETWHRQFQEIRKMAELAAATGKALVGPDGSPLPFPEPPCPGWHSGEDTIIPLCTAEEVLAEGNQMHNCVASRVGEAFSGRAFLYHGEVGGRSLTIQIARQGGRYHVAEAKTSANSDPRLAQEHVLVEFVSHLRVGEQCGCTPADLKRRAVGR